MDFAKLQDFVQKKKSALAHRQRALQLKGGPNRLVVLPGWNKTNREVFLRAFGAHYVKNAAGETTAVYPCSDKIDGTPCPVCEALGKAAKVATSPDALKLLEQAGSSQRYLFNVLALDSDNPNTPQVLDVPKTVAVQILGMMADWGPQLFDPVSPQTITVEKSGTGMLTKYVTQVSPKKHTLPAGALDALHDLDEYVRQESEEQMTRTLSSISNVAGMIGTSNIAPALPVNRDVPVVASAPAPKHVIEDAVIVHSKPAPTLEDDVNALLDDIDLDAA